MQLLNGRYAQEFNGRHDRFGHLFADRFSCRVVEVDVAGGHAARVDMEVAVRKRGAKDAGHALDESGRSTERSRLWIDRRTLVAKALSVADVSRV
jgi:hypothetical protein